MRVQRMRGRTRADRRPRGIIGQEIGMDNAYPMHQPVYFISHGGGPWPWMPQLRKPYAALSAALSAIPASLPKPPDAILMVSAHWVTQGEVRIASNPYPGMIYDYHGFPARTYGIHYPAPGSPELAARVLELLKDHSIAASADAERGYDHGAFVPAFVIFPGARIPMVQLSIQAGFDPAAHLALGAALQPLRARNILIIGSGLSFHNLQLFNAEGKAPSAQFDTWLQSVLVGTPAEARHRHLLAWAQAPSARLAHPVEDHLMPLLVASGAAGNDGAQCFHHEIDVNGSLTVSSFRFG